MLRVRRPQICRHVITRPPLPLPFVLNLIHVRIERCQLGRADQHLLLASGGVHVPQLTLLSFSVALHKCELGPVRTPLHSLGLATRQSPRLVQGFNGQRLGRGSLRFCRRGNDDTRDKCEQGKAPEERNLSFHERSSQARNNGGCTMREARVYTGCASARSDRALRRIEPGGRAFYVFLRSASVPLRVLYG